VAWATSTIRSLRVVAKSPSLPSRERGRLARIPHPTLPCLQGRVGWGAAGRPRSQSARRGRATAILSQETLSAYRVCLGDQSGAATAQDLGGERAIYRALESHRLTVEFRHGARAAAKLRSIRYTRNSISRPSTASWRSVNSFTRTAAKSASSGGSSVTTAVREAVRRGRAAWSANSRASSSP